MITLTTSGLNCVDWSNCNPVMRHITENPLDPPSPSRYPFLGEVEFLLFAVILWSLLLSSPKEGLESGISKPGVIRAAIIFSFWAVRLLLSHHGGLQVLHGLCKGLPMSLLCSWDVFPIGFGFLVVLPEPFFLLLWNQLVNISRVLDRREAMVHVISRELDAINLKGNCHNLNLFCVRWWLNDCGEVWSPWKLTL